MAVPLLFIQLYGLLPPTPVWFLALNGAQPLHWHGVCGHCHLHPTKNSGTAASHQNSTGLILAILWLLLLSFFDILNFFLFW